MKVQNSASTAEAAFRQAVALYQSGRLIEALASFDRAIHLRPGVPQGHFYRGLVLYELKRFETALASYDRAIALRNNFVEAYSNRGNTLVKLKRLDDALASFSRAIALEPDYADAYGNRGYALHTLNRPEEALANYDRCIALQPDSAWAHSNRGNTLLMLCRLNDAIASYDRAIALKPQYAEAYHNRGLALKTLLGPADALASFEHAIAMRPDYAEAYFNRGMVLKDLKRLDDALASYDRALALKPDYAEAYWAKSNLCLLMGDYEQGWQLQEWRLSTGQYKSVIRDSNKPRWVGSSKTQCSGNAKTLLVYAEAGLGDTIQYCRYVSLLKDLNIKVLLEVPSSLVTLMSTLEGPASVVESGKAVSDFDQHCPIGSLPLSLGTTLATIPAKVPYLYADPDKLATWRRRLGVKVRPRVGLVWSGQANRAIDSSPAQNRSIPLRLLKPLLQLPFEFHSLQKDIRPDDAAVLSEIKQIYQHRDDLKDFADTAALINELDFVISIDTSVAHLVGALGQQIWVLLPFSTDYRWTLTGTTTPWYPTATLFRQPTIGDWESVVSEVANQLEEYISRTA